MPEPPTVASALALARELGVERLDAQLLLAHQLGRTRAWLLAHGEAPVPESASLHTAFARRAAGEPLAYLVGEREFRGLSLRVTPDVLVPRPDTETLVDWALDLLTALTAPRIVDLGTGSGAIALAIKHACPQAQVHATDSSPAALAVARDNGQRLTLPVNWHLGDWWEAPDPALRFDLAVANPPYVAAGDPHLAALRHEPYAALVARNDRGDGMADIERIVGGAADHLRTGAWLLIEHGFNQSHPVCSRLRQAGFEAIASRADLAGHPRVSGGRLGTGKD